LEILVICSHGCLPVVFDVSHWEDILLEDVGFQNLRTLNILVDAFSVGDVDKAVRTLDCSPAIAEI
jgi:hypothetical protein